MFIVCAEEGEPCSEQTSIGSYDGAQKDESDEFGGTFCVGAEYVVDFGLGAVDDVGFT